MFATFNSSMDSASTSTAGAASRPKRVTVARACDFCRLNRIKCDHHSPCRNCRQRNIQCTKGRLTEPTDTRELDRLRNRVAEIEEQLRKSHSQEEAKAKASANVPAWNWKGIFMQSRYYGPSSMNYFVHRLSVYLSESLSEPGLANQLLSCNNHRAAVSLSDTLQRDFSSDPFGNHLSRQQEEYLLSLFWQSYHSITPIVEEDELRAHYDSLWSGGDAEMRSPSALIDIVLSLCLQYSSALIASGSPEMQFGDSNTGGQWLYHRCQMLLSGEDEASVSTLQCRAYSAIYLLNANCLDQCRSSLAMAVDTAYSLGLQHGPSDTLSQGQQALLRRIWWTLYFLDTKISLELGRPYLINPADVTVQLDSKHNDIPNLDGDMLTYHTEYTKLTILIRTLSTNTFTHASTLMSTQSGSIHDNLPILDQISSHLRQNMSSLQTWIKEVPSMLKIPRKASGDAFSTSKSPLEIDIYAPLWLQRQQVLLELLYHNLVMYIYRPFMRFPPFSPSPTSHSSTRRTDGNALLALNHAITTINIVHQVLTETGILDSWNRALQYTWDAVVTVLGFVVVHPVCPYTFAARRAIAVAIDDFHTFAGWGFPAASNAANIVREIHEMIDATVKSFGLPRGSSSQGTGTSQPVTPGSGSSPFDLCINPSQLPSSSEHISIDLGLSDILPPMNDFDSWQSWEAIP